MTRKGFGMLGIIGIAVAILLLVGGGAFLSDSDVVPASFIQLGGCSWDPLEIEGQSFSSLSELSSEAQAQGTSVDELRSRGFSFRENGGQVEVRPDTCGVQEVGTGE